MVSRKLLLGRGIGILLALVVRICRSVDRRLSRSLVQFRVLAFRLVKVLEVPVGNMVVVILLVHFGRIDFMKRMRESASRRKKSFGRNAMKQHKRNIPSNPMRGGIRL